MRNLFSLRNLSQLKSAPDRLFNPLIPLFAVPFSKKHRMLHRCFHANFYAADERAQCFFTSIERI